MNNGLPPGRLLGQHSRVALHTQHIWTAAAVDVIDSGVPFIDTTHTVRIIDVAHQHAVLIPFDRDGLERLRQSITAALDSHTHPTQQEESGHGIS